MMNAIRRSYIYIVLLISLQVISWALIAMVRNIIDLPLDRTGFAWQLALLIIGGPIFGGHWLWAQRLAAAQVEELASPQRRFYLFAMLASLLGPFLAQTVFLLDDLLRYLQLPESVWPAATLRSTLSAMVVLAVLWLFHWRLWQADGRQVGETAVLATIRRLYQWGFTLVGLVMILNGVTGLLTRLFELLFDEFKAARPLIDELPLLMVGVPLLAVFWRWNQRLFAQDRSAEQNSLLRKVYLYVVLFVAMVTAVTNAAILLASLLQAAWGIDTSGSLSEVLALILAAVATWAAHLWVLKQDERAAPDVQQQITIRQLYQYLSAGVGLLALLIGVGGLLSVVIRALAGESYDRVEISWFVATVAAGLPLWLWFWRTIQYAAVADDDSAAEHDSFVRRVYLYLFIFLATLTILSAGVYIVYRLVSLLMRLSVGGSAAVDLGHALAYGLLALVIWLYHGQLIRADSGRQSAARERHLAAVRLLLLDTADEALNQTLLAELRQTLPQVQVEFVSATAAGEAAAEEAVAGEAAAERSALLERIRTADVLVGVWTMAMNESVSEWWSAVMGSPAAKILLPVPREGWLWAGVDEWEPQQVAQDVVAQVEQLATKRQMKQKRRWSVGAIIGTVLAALVVLVITFVLAVTVIDFWF
ncbi:MAG: hypothetical protein KDE51_08330 [Anaerolineales bacterium]|nr:hypothetical protein [Anaerolineales bacterium]